MGTRSSSSSQMNKLAKPWFQVPENSCRLFLGDCLEILPLIPEGSIDLIFADPPYFLSNGGITCHAGRMVPVDKGKWDVSQGSEQTHAFNQRRRCRARPFLRQWHNWRGVHGPQAFLHGHRA